MLGFFNSKFGRIVSILLLIALSAAASYFFFLSGGADKALEAMEERKKNEMGPLMDFQGVIVNIAETKGQRYLKTSISLEITNEKEYKELKKIAVKIQDRIITILSSLTLEELETNHKEGKLKVVLADEINRLAGKESVKNVYFTEFVMQ